jgi:hypothetical protein
MKLWKCLERILCAERRFVLVRAMDDFHAIVQQRGLCFDFANCDEFV